MQFTKHIKDLLFPVVSCGIYAGTPPKDIFKIGNGILNPTTGELYSHSTSAHKKCTFTTNEDALSLAQQLFHCNWSHAFYSQTDTQNRYHFFSNLIKPHFRIEVVNSYSNQLPPKYHYCFEDGMTTIYTNVPLFLLQKGKKVDITNIQIVADRFKEVREKALTISPFSAGFVFGKCKVYMPIWVNDILPREFNNAWEQMLHIAKTANLWAKSSWGSARDFCASVYNLLYIRG